ncbi:homocysteine-responsive endoplasmic reticulum-resident ubiquitin-like domain member 2 protein isoform X2 [Gadus chalcogrammus]|uniref:homocysteine-responsive endoplasmic reticulum-resident ubiquitin-like domain member 2 protein isoform X2 n=1 Tax=Gadus chalcogrammus TaxID=1042646 RepID=UPI0024C4DD08|nr:homocysteine-responsive endoplasmic reticulum-resident ubiquitin-like domain member 2 protein isoform X2 [Gadus chalcogrammus]
MDPGVADIPVILVIKAPNQKYTDQRINCFENWTVEKLKAHLTDVYPSKPSSKDQRLVYSGKLLLDHLTLKDVLRTDEYHMLHLVCASRTPPPSPKAHGSSNKAPPGPPAGPTSFANPSTSQSGQSQSSDGVQHRTHGPYYPMHPAFMHGLPWNQYSPQPVPPTNPTESPTYNTMTLMWWQQQYFRQYYMHYQAWSASAQQHWRNQPAGAAWPMDASQPPREYRHGNNVNNNNVEGAQAAARPADAPNNNNEEEENRDWLDWVYTMSRTAILISIVYFYSSFSRFVLVMGAILVLNLHQAGWFPFNLENDAQAGEDGALPEDNADPQEGAMDDTLDDDDDDPDEDNGAGADDNGVGADDNTGVGGDEDNDGGAGAEGEGAEDTDVAPQANFLSTTWSFIVTFFMSLIPEGPQNAVN